MKGGIRDSVKGRLKPTNIVILTFALLILGRYIYSPVSIVIVSGTSMRPNLDIGDLVILVKTDFSEGDVVLWCRDNLNCILHRIEEINGSQVITRGDANEIPDPPIPIQKVEYKAISTIPSYIWIPFMLLTLYILNKYEGRKERFH